MAKVIFLTVTQFYPRIALAPYVTTTQAVLP